MLCFIPNENKNGVTFLFRDMFTKEKEYESTYNLNECEEIAKDLLKIVKELRKGE